MMTSVISSVVICWHACYFAAGQVIKGWDLGIKTMKKGENAIFTIPPGLAYGETGSPPTISPNATLQFDVELLSWASVKDICKDGGIFKKILVEGEKWENPKDLDEVFGMMLFDIL
jgi:FK506-binding protein 4/5